MLEPVFILEEIAQRAYLVWKLRPRDPVGNGEEGREGPSCQSAGSATLSLILGEFWIILDG